MINSYKQRYVCEPVYTMAGRLVAMEVLTSFTTPEGNAVSYNDVTDILTPEYKWLNFVRQLYGVSCWQNWLVRHHIVISLNVDADTAVWLLRDKAVLSMIAKMPFIRLEVHEHFPTSDKEKRGNEKLIADRTLLRIKCAGFNRTYTIAAKKHRIARTQLTGFFAVQNHTDPFCIWRGQRR